MKLQTGIITEKLTASRDFFRRVFHFEIKFENEWFVLLHAPDRPENELAFMLPGVEALRLPQFQKAYGGSGVWLILESRDIEAEFRRVADLGVTFAVPLTREDWGDTHFTVLDPNGIAVDVVAERQA